LTGRAGVKRLIPKYPQSGELLDAWDSRWNVLVSALLILSTLMEVGALVFGLLAFTPGGAVVTLFDVASIFMVVLVFTLALEILPEALSESYADKLSMLSLRFVVFLTRITYPLAWPLARIDSRLRKQLMSTSDEEDHPSAEDAIRSLVGEPNGMDLEEEEREIIRSVFEFGETITREIMTPRVAMECFEDADTVAACADEVKSSVYSRFPVFHESIDDIQGVIHVKDILRLLDAGKRGQRIISAAKPMPFVPESMPINDLLQLLRSEQAQMAIVVDEYGGTAGLVTVEDVVEELVGEIQDEYDTDEKAFHELSDGSAVLDARTPVDEVNEMLGIQVPVSEEYDSLGGFIFHELGRIPRPGEVVNGAGFTITIQTANARQLQRLRIQRIAREDS
jgi:putative hemolysin